MRSSTCGRMTGFGALSQRRHDGDEFFKQVPSLSADVKPRSRIHGTDNCRSNTTFARVAPHRRPDFTRTTTAGRCAIDTGRAVILVDGIQLATTRTGVL